MHHLSYITIKNFRACKQVSLPLEAYTPIVGQNNTGKSTILSAIGWVVKPFKLSPSDFHDPQFPVEISACIDGINNEVLNLIPDQKHQKSIAPYCRSGRLWIRAMASITGGKAPRQEIWDIDHSSDDSPPSSWRDYPTGLPQAVSALLPEPLFVQAMHDIGEDLGKVKAGTTIKELLDEIMLPLLKTHQELRNALDTIHSILTANGNNRSEHLYQFDAKVTDVLSHFFPGLALDLDLQTLDVKEFFKAGDLHVTDQVTGDRRRFDQMGAGAQRAIQMSLIRYLAEMRNENSNNISRRLLLIDEPELFLHPQGVRWLRQALASLSVSGFQVIFSTHSPLMLSRDNAAGTVIVSKSSNEGVTVRKPLRRAVEDAIQDAKSQSHALFEIGNLSDVYFSEKVVICEGKTERRLLPLVYEKLFHKSPDLDKISFVSIGSCADIPKTLSVLKAMEIFAYAIADLDFAFTHACKSGISNKADACIDDTIKILKKLQPEKGFYLNENGFPQNKNSWTATKVWACFAEDPEGQEIANINHNALKDNNIWIWTQGCIEQVMGITDKGENAIARQERRLRSMNSIDIEKAMPAFKNCFDWIRNT